MRESLKIIQWGIGAIGIGIAKLILEKKGIEIVGAIDADPEKVGRDLGELLSLRQSLGVIVSDDPEPLLYESKADMVLIATRSLIKEVIPQIELAVKAGLNVITTAEEMGYPWAQHRSLAEQMDRLAKKYGVTILGTGLNPGFALDILIIVLTGICAKVEKIKAVRINDISEYGPVVLDSMGVGKTKEEFQQALEKGTISGHVGYPESMTMIADSLGWQLDEVKQTKEPVISKTPRKTPYIEIKPGMVAGCKEIAQGIMNRKAVIEFEQIQQILPEAEGINVGDYIGIKGTPNINQSIKGGMPGSIGTIAIVVNMVPRVIEAKPGLVTMKDLPVPSAFQDFSRLVKGRKLKRV